MADSDITIDSLAVTAGFGQNFLKSAFTDPHAAGLLNLSLDKIEYWAATSNNRNAATLAVEGLQDAIHVASDGAARYYWARGRNRQGYYTDWYPASATGGVAAAQSALLAVPGYIKLPGGLIIQWGNTAASDASGFAAATFPLAFPSNIFYVAGQVSNNNNQYVPVANLYTDSLSAVTFLCTAIFRVAPFGVTNLNENILAGVTVNYIAFGN